MISIIICTSGAQLWSFFPVIFNCDCFIFTCSVVVIQTAGNEWLVSNLHARNSKGINSHLGANWHWLLRKKKKRGISTTDNMIVFKKFVDWCLCYFYTIHICVYKYTTRYMYEWNQVQYVALCMDCMQTDGLHFFVVFFVNFYVWFATYVVYLIDRWTLYVEA